jgi:hypothetical protein
MAKTIEAMPEEVRDRFKALKVLNVSTPTIRLVVITASRFI